MLDKGIWVMGSPLVDSEKYRWDKRLFAFVSHPE
jgi:hypothetical protein